MSGPEARGAGGGVDPAGTAAAGPGSVTAGGSAADRPTAASDAFPEVGDDVTLALADALVEVAAPHVAGILLFGSRLAGTSPGRHSAWDFVVVVDAYRDFYRRLVEAGHHSRSPRLLATLAHLLPPNIISFAPDLPDEPLAKCIVLSAQDFERALSPTAPDHFLKGRMMQRVGVVYARDRHTASWLRSLLADGRRDVLRWVAPHLDETFTAAELARTMLRVSYRGEVRPESAGRVDEVFAAQREWLVERYGEVAGEELRRGALRQVEEGRYALARRPGALDAFLNRLYFTRSKLRAAGRWFKYVFTYEGWLEYIQRKLERRTGRRIEVTDRERKYPFIFLWPKFFRVLRTLPGAGGNGDGPDEVRDGAGASGRAGTS